MKPVNCPFFYGDYHRGKEHEECRLIGRNPRSRPWRRALCNRCVVPNLMRDTGCKELVIEGEVTKVFGFIERVRVTYAICMKHRIELADPRVCPECAKERQTAAAS